MRRAVNALVLVLVVIALNVGMMTLLDVNMPLTRQVIAGAVNGVILLVVMRIFPGSRPAP